jgi:hypothetical protein
LPNHRPGLVALNLVLRWWTVAEGQEGTFLFWMLTSVVGDGSAVVGSGSPVALIAVCCVTTCIVPMRRALGVQPTEPLKDDG